MPLPPFHQVALDAGWERSHSMRRLLQIADLVVAVESDGRTWDFVPDSAHRFFEVAEGTPEQVAQVPGSYTGQCLSADLLLC